MKANRRSRWVRAALLSVPCLALALWSFVGSDWRNPPGPKLRSTWKLPPTRQLATTGELAALAGQPGWLIVDTRDSDSLNGWTLRDDQPRGHVPGAINVRAQWIDTESDRVQQIFDAHLTAEDQVVLYGDSDADTRKVAAFRFHRAGVAADRIVISTTPTTSWQHDEMPVTEFLARFEKLVPPTWLRRQMIDSVSGDFCVIEAGWKTGDEYASGHIPGAIYLDTGVLESAPMWNVVPAMDLELVLRTTGLSYRAIARRFPLFFQAKIAVFQ